MFWRRWACFILEELTDVENRHADGIQMLMTHSHWQSRLSTHWRVTRHCIHLSLASNDCTWTNLWICTNDPVMEWHLASEMGPMCLQGKAAPGIMTPVEP